MNILTFVNGLTRSGGGPSMGIPAINNAMARLGVRCALVNVRTVPGELSLPEQGLVELVMVEGRGLRAGRLNWAPGLKKAFESKLLGMPADLVHSRGVWSLANHTAVQLALKHKRPLVITPHGSLTLWSFRHKGWKKRLAWAAYQKGDMQRATVVHATAQSEADDLRALGLQKPIAVIQNGVEIPELKTAPPSGENRTRRALFLSRIHPKKGLLNLVEAWADLKPKGWKMVIAGPDEGGHRQEVEKALRARGIEGDFEFTGEVYGDSKWELYQGSDLFILPTHNENFGIAIAEAMACALPVLTTHGAPWGELEERSCGWWIPVGVDPLRKTLPKALALSDAERRAMGLRGRRLIEEKYSWDGVAKSMKTLYEWMLGGGNPPGFMRFD